MLHDGELTDHTETVRQRLFNIVAPVFGNKPAHTITEQDVLDFLDGLKGQNGGKASLVTRTQYLNLLKSVFKFAVEQGRVPQQYNPVANLKPAKKRKDAEPEILTVGEVKRIFSFVKNNPKFPKNCIRHTAASFMAEQQGYTETAHQWGHDISMLLKHYRRAITKTEAEEFYNITPDSV